MGKHSAHREVDAEPVSLLLQGQLRQGELSQEELQIGLQLAKNHMIRGAFAEAMRVYVGLVLCEPLDSDFQIGLANCASYLGEHHVALQAASCVIALAPSDPRGYLLSGRSCMMIGQFAEAHEDLMDALSCSEPGSFVHAEATRLLEKVVAAGDMSKVASTDSEKPE